MSVTDMFFPPRWTKHVRSVHVSSRMAKYPTTSYAGFWITLVGSGIVDEDVTGAKFTAKVTAHGAPLASCEGDGTQDTVCKLPLGAGTITVKKVAFPFAKGSRVPISVDVQTSLLIPASLASVDTAVRATDQNGESVICMDVHTAQQAELEAMVGGAVKEEVANSTLILHGDASDWCLKPPCCGCHCMPPCPLCNLASCDCPNCYGEVEV